MTEPTNKRQRQDDTTVSLTLDQCKLLQESFKSIADLMGDISKLKAEADTSPVSINDERIVDISKLKAEADTSPVSSPSGRSGDGLAAWLEPTVGAFVLNN